MSDLSNDDRLRCPWIGALGSAILVLSVTAWTGCGAEPPDAGPLVPSGDQTGVTGAGDASADAIGSSSRPSSNDTVDPYESYYVLTEEGLEARPWRSAPRDTPAFAPPDLDGAAAQRSTWHDADEDRLYEAFWNEEGWFVAYWDRQGWYDTWWDEAGWYEDYWDDQGWYEEYWDDEGWFEDYWDDVGWMLAR